ncbi:PilZ domain-containing protein [Geodermatophilus sp. SYSU D00815]
MSANDADRPLESSEADVTLVTKGITVTARVEVSTEHALVVRPTGEAAAWKLAIQPGDPVEVFWVGGNEERTLPAKVEEAEEGEAPLWHLRPTGPATRSQRRKAVRARVAVPVVIPWAGSQMAGETVDLSEAGMRALLDGWGLPPESGNRLPITLDLGGSSVDLRGEVVWQTTRGPQWLLAVRFEDVPERDGDLLRRKVFEALRAERAAAAR